MRDTRYRFYVSDNRVICVAEWAGKRIKASAKCNVEAGDQFDMEAGKALARARVDETIAHRRAKKAKERVASAEAAVAEAERRLKRALEFESSARFDAASAAYVLNQLLK